MSYLPRASKRGRLDSFGGDIIHPEREGRNDQQYGKKVLPNHR